MSKIVREMFAALVENTVKRMSNSYAAITYFQEKLKLLIKKQSAMFEVLNQFSATLPFLMYTFTHGPIPRFAYWLKSYLGHTTIDTQTQFSRPADTDIQSVPNLPTPLGEEGRQPPCKGLMVHPPTY